MAFGARVISLGCQVAVAANKTRDPSLEYGLAYFFPLLLLKHATLNNPRNGNHIEEHS